MPDRTRSAEKIADFRRQAELLERIRFGLARWLEGYIIPMALPCVQAQLPSGWLANYTHSRIFSTYSNKHRGSALQEGRVPNGFGLHVRLTYQGKPVYVVTRRPEGANESIGDLQRSLRPKLKKIGRKYGLSEVEVCGEPGEISRTTSHRSPILRLARYRLVE
jgi:hypothetical protein